MGSPLFTVHYTMFIVLGTILKWFSLQLNCMQTDPNNTPQKDNAGQQAPARDEKVAEAFQQAEHDIEEDPDFQDPGPTADMDEGEIARFESGDDPQEKPTNG